MSTIGASRSGMFGKVFNRLGFVRRKRHRARTCPPPTFSRCLYDDLSKANLPKIGSTGSFKPCRRGILSCTDSESWTGLSALVIIRHVALSADPFGRHHPRNRRDDDPVNRDRTGSSDGSACACASGNRDCGIRGGKFSRSRQRRWQHGKRPDHEIPRNARPG